MGKTLGNINAGYGNTLGTGTTKSSILGGESNTISASTGSFIGGGGVNTISNGSNYSFIGGGYKNAITGSTSDRFVAFYKEVSGSDTLLDQHSPGGWGETETRFARTYISGSYLDNTTGTVKYKVKVYSAGTAGTIHYRSNLTVFEIKG